jgi:hypothetical protein
MLAGLKKKKTWLVVQVMGVDDINVITLISTLTWTWLVIQVMKANDINEVILTSTLAWTWLVVPSKEN